MEDNSYTLYADWATDMLVAGFDSDNLGRLAGIESTYPQGDLEKLVAQVFDEFDLRDCDEVFAGKCYCTMVIHSIIDNSLSLDEGLFKLYKLVLKLDYDPLLMDFYILYHAKTALLIDNFQFYWKGANKENIRNICFNRFTKWLKAHPVPLTS